MRPTSSPARSQGTFDAALFRAVIQVLSEGDAQKALAHARATLSPGGSVYILGQILDDDMVRPWVPRC